MGEVEGGCSTGEREHVGHDQDARERRRQRARCSRGPRVNVGCPGHAVTTATPPSVARMGLSRRALAAPPPWRAAAVAPRAAPRGGRTGPRRHARATSYAGAARAPRATPGSSPPRRAAPGAHRPRCRGRARPGPATRAALSRSRSSATCTSSTCSRRCAWSGPRPLRGPAPRRPRPGIFASAYRPQEMLTAQVADAMVRADQRGRPRPGHWPAAGVRRPDRRQLRQLPATTRSAGTSTSSTAAGCVPTPAT